MIAFLPFLLHKMRCEDKRCNVRGAIVFFIASMYEK